MPLKESHIKKYISHLLFSFVLGIIDGHKANSQTRNLDQGVPLNQATVVFWREQKGQQERRKAKAWVGSVAAES